MKKFTFFFTIIFVSSVGYSLDWPLSISKAVPSPSPSQGGGLIQDAVESDEDEQLISQELSLQEGEQEKKDTGTYWTPPDFSKQEEALGWTNQIFEVPPGFHRRYSFW